MTRARITIGMPVYNAGPAVEEAVASLLAQTFEEWTLVAIDDGSTDDTADRIARFADPRIHLLRGDRNLGLPARLNEAVARAETPLFARMDGDDVSYPERLARQVAYLERHPECDVVATHMLVVDPQNEPRGLEAWRGSAHEDVTARPWRGFHFNHATWLGQTAWFRRFPYRRYAVRCEDDDLLLRAYRSSRLARLPQVLYGYRVGALDAGAIRTARLHFVRSLLRECIAQRDPRLLLGIPGQAVRAAVEALAIPAGWERKLLRHRAGDLPPEEVERWQAVRAAVGRHLPEPA